MNEQQPYFYFGPDIQILPSLKKDTMLDVNTDIKTKVLLLIGTIETSKKPPDCFWTYSGDFDSQGMSFGPLQWNFGQTTFQSLLLKMITSFPKIFVDCFGASADILKEILVKSSDEQMKWVRSIQTKNKINPDWALKFTLLGKTLEFQNIMVQDANFKYFARAKGMMSVYGLKSERGFALLSDICVQSGNIKDSTRDKILSSYKNDTNEIDKMKLISTYRSQDCNPKWQSDVLNRKMTIATGKGVIHQIHFDLEKDYFITMKDAIFS